MISFLERRQIEKECRANIIIFSIFFFILGVLAGELIAAHWARNGWRGGGTTENIEYVKEKEGL